MEEMAAAKLKVARNFQEIKRVRESALQEMKKREDQAEVKAA